MNALQSSMLPMSQHEVDPEVNIIQAQITKIAISRLNNDFYKACGSGDIAAVKLKLTKPHLDVNRLYPETKQSPLYAACNGSHLNVVRELLQDARVDVNSKCSVNCGLNLPPLWEACSSGRFEVVKLMLTREDLDVNGDQGNLFYAPLFAACKGGDIDVVQLLLADRRLKVSEVASEWWGPYGLLALGIACEKSHIEIVKLLLSDKRVEINATAWATTFVEGHSMSTNLLACACKGRDMNIVQLLLKDARVPVEGSFGTHALAEACTLGLRDIIDLLLADPRVSAYDENHSDPLSSACKGGHLDIVEQLLARPEVKVNGNKLHHPLTAACEGGHLDIVERLLSLPEINVNGSKNHHPLTMACFKRYPNVVWRLLLDSRVQNGRYGINSYSSFYLACKEALDIEVVRLFLDKQENLLVRVADAIFRKMIKKTSEKILELLVGMSTAPQYKLLKEGLMRNWDQIPRNKLSPAKAELLDDFGASQQGNQEATRKLKKLYLDHLRCRCSSVFALVVYLCDDFLAIRGGDTGSGAKRFFRIAQRLPIELQMILVNRLGGFPHDFFTLEQREGSFRSVSRWLM